MVARVTDDWPPSMRQLMQRAKLELVADAKRSRRSTTIDTSNRFVVGGNALGELVLHAPPRPGVLISEEDALNLAAWLVAIVGQHDRFLEVLEAIEST